MDRYHLVRMLGDGGMGAVYKAADQVLRRFVAIKLLHSSTAQNPSSVERFVREARSAAAIGHPNIIDVIDFGEENGRPFLVMEYLRGRSLSQAISSDGPFSVKRAASIGVHMLSGLAAAHELGILHRDLKPANLMLVAYLGDPDFVKVCDFGFAALVNPSTRIGDERLTPVRTLVGTPAYAAPERLRGDDRRDPRIDIYSVGVVLYEMLAGRRPFHADTFRALSRKVRKEPAPPLRSFRPDVPDAISDAIHKALAKSPEDRWSSAADFANALMAFGGKFIPRDDYDDSFTMDLARLRAREALRQRETERSGQDARPIKNKMVVRDGNIEDFGEEGATAVDPPPDLGHARGELVMTILRGISDRYGERALTGVLKALPEEHRLRFDVGVSTSDWVPVVTVVELVANIDHALGNDDLHMVIECGRIASTAAEPPSEKYGELTPHLLLTHIKSVMGEWLQGWLFELAELGDGYAEVRVVERHPNLTASVFSLGVLEAWLTRLGGQDVEVTMTQSRALDDPETILAITWLDDSAVTKRQPSIDE